MIRFYCNDCKSLIPDERNTINITISLPKTENQRTARAQLCADCAKEMCKDFDIEMPTETHPAGRNERDAKTSRVGMQPARSWAPGNNK